MPTRAADLPGAKDPPTLKRIEGAQIFFYKQERFDEMPIAMQRVERDGHTGKVNDAKKEVVQGPHTTVYYALPMDASPVEAVAQYGAELKARGFEEVWQGAGNELDNGYNLFVTSTFPDVSQNSGLRYLHGFNNAEPRYVALRGKNAGGDDQFVSVYACKITDDSGTGFPELKKQGNLRKGQTIARVDVLERKSLDARMVTVKAEEMQSAIEKTGRIALYGILFDTDKTDVKPESQPALEQIARLVKATPGKKFLLVGHTDNQGGLDYNQNLSQRRARSVTEMLARAHGVDPAQIVPVGVGMAAPVAPNVDEPGRAKNRRVEIVAM